jgi:hypothetical protein
MPRQTRADRDVIQQVMPAVVQIVALRQAFAGNYAPAWTGSGIIVHPQGVILTNCHVANPRAMGMPAPPADLLAVAIMERSEEPPVLTYVADIIAQSPELDLAVLRLVGDVNGRPVVDTTGDGRIDQRNTPMAVGGFINGLRPVNLTKDLLKKAGVTPSPSSTRLPKTTGARKRTPRAATPGKLPSLKTPGAERPAKGKGPQFTGLVFSERVTRDGRPVNPSAILSGKTRQIFASFTFDGMRKGTKWDHVWAFQGKPVMEDEGKWEDGPRGRKTAALGSQKALPEGRYKLVLSVREQVVAQREVVVGRQVDDTDTEISGQVIDRETKRGVAEALVIALNPGVRAQAFVRDQRRDMAFTSARTDRNGRFTLAKQLPKEQSYSLVAVARGYRDMAVDGALRVGPNAPERAQIHAVPMIPD